MKTKTEENYIDIEIKGVYDGVCVKYYKDTDEFVWKQVSLGRTTELDRNMFELNFRSQIINNSDNDENH